MSKEMEYFIYLLEHYAYDHNTTADKVMKKLKELDLVDYVYNNYELYHIESTELVYEDIDNKIKEKENNDEKKYNEEK